MRVALLLMIAATVLGCGGEEQARSDSPDELEVAGTYSYLYWRWPPTILMLFEDRSYVTVTLKSMRARDATDINDSGTWTAIGSRVELRSDRHGTSTFERKLGILKSTSGRILIRQDGV